MKNVPSSALSSVEEAVLKKLLAGNLSLLIQLRQQLKVCSVGMREVTGFGFYTTLVVPDNTARIAGLDFKFGDVVGNIPELSSGAGFLLYVKDGVLDMLEGYSYDEPWPPSVNDFNLKYVKGEDRDWVALEEIFNGSSGSRVGKF